MVTSTFEQGESAGGADARRRVELRSRGGSGLSLLNMTSLRSIEREMTPPDAYVATAPEPPSRSKRDFLSPTSNRSQPPARSRSPTTSDVSVLNNTAGSSRFMGLLAGGATALRRTSSVLENSPSLAHSAEKALMAPPRGHTIANLLPAVDERQSPAAAGSREEESRGGAMMKRFALRNLGRSGGATSPTNRRKTLLFKVGGIYPVLPGTLSWTSVRTEPRPPRTEHWFCVDSVLEYYPFASDFGPLNLSCVHKFVEMMRQMAKDPTTREKHIVLYTGNSAELRTNAVFLLGAYLVLEHKMAPDDAWALFACIHPSPFCGFRDATFSGGDFPLSIVDCLRGLKKSTQVGMYIPPKFNPAQYDYYDSPKNGDLHIVVPGKFVAFKGPTRTRIRNNGIYSHTPKDFLDVFKSLGVQAIVRLNSPEYDAEDFTKRGLEHYDLYFEDCTCPSDAIVRMWMDICDKQKGVIAVHCLAGLGRTGTLIALWLMREYQFTACDAISALRILRPGSIISSQQHYLQANEKGMWEWGERGVWSGSYRGGAMASQEESVTLAKQVTDGMYRRMLERSGHKDTSLAAEHPINNTC